MNKNLKIALLVAVVLIIITTIVVFLVIFFTAERKDEANSNTNVVINTNTTTNQNVNTNSSETNTNSTTSNVNTNFTPTGSTGAETFLKPIARNFTERYGSYSNHGDYENITKLEVYMSTTMKKWAEKYVAEEKANSNPDDEYYGITTKALSVTVDSMDEENGTAQFAVSTQRNEAKASEEANIIYQDMKIEFVMESNDWKVNNATWL